MKGGPFFRNFVLSTGFIAIIPAIIIIFFLPALGSKYTLSVKPAQRNTDQYVYSDVNSDSISEIIHKGKGLPYYFIAVRDINLQIFDQWNLKDSLNPNISEIITGNYDHDRFSEIYVFTHKKDSLFLNVNEILDPYGIKMERIFITKIGFTAGEVASILYPVGFYDENEDGKDEFYFGISTAFNLGPRQLFSYDLVNRTLKASQNFAIIPLYPKMIDTDEDQKPEIFGTMSASGNFRANVPFSDSSTWFMVFNDKLKFEFPPTEFPGFANGLGIYSFNSRSFNGFVLSHWAGGADTSVLDSRIMLFSPDGKLIRYRLSGDFGDTKSFKLFIVKEDKGDKIYYLGEKLLELNEKLEVVRSRVLPFKTQIFSYQADIDFDGKDELLLYSEEEQKLVVYGDDLQKLSAIKINFPETDLKFSEFLTVNHKQRLYLNSGKNSYLVKMTRNNYYYLGYLAYPGIYFLFFAFIVLIKRINTMQVIQKERLKQRLITLQLQGIKSQLDPHFTFNTLNSVASLIYLEDKVAAYDYLNKFTQLLRGMLNDAERIYRSLSEELTFVTTYLDLEKLRFGEKFNYTVEIGEGITQNEMVPKLVLQTFAENAVKHGILPHAEGGLIRISVFREINYLKLIVEDNGIGRVKSEGHSTSTGKGLKLIGEFYDILNQINKKPLRHSITDLYNESGLPTGTRVEVWVPIDLQDMRSRK
jgi:hypothetical protein